MLDRLSVKQPDSTHLETYMTNVIFVIQVFPRLLNLFFAHENNVGDVECVWVEWVRNILQELSFSVRTVALKYSDPLTGVPLIAALKN